MAINISCVILLFGGVRNSFSSQIIQKYLYSLSVPSDIKMQSHLRIKYPVLTATITVVLLDSEKRSLFYYYI